jgi:hypothetical protein
MGNTFPGANLMAIYTTFLLVHPKELTRGFRGWKLPLPAPVRREVQVWYSKELISVKSREPIWSKAKQPEPPAFVGVMIAGSYEEYLEKRLPPFVQKQPHWASKGLTEIEIAPLLRILGFTKKLKSPLYAPPAWSSTLQEFPAAFLPKLRNSERKDVARQWAAVMSTRDYTHSISGRRLSKGWTIKQASESLDPLIALAQKSKPGQRMYLLTEA